MPRKPRIWYPGAMYHITCRGNRQTSLFHDRYDRLKYLDILEQTRERYPFYLLTYCLMTNHIHLQLKTIHDPINYIMHDINAAYAKYFNKKYDYVGHLFQGRYGAKIIVSEDYELKVSRYIHLNPVEAGIVGEPESYPWSSCYSYVSKSNNPHVLTTRILSFFPFPQKEAYKKYLIESKSHTV